MAKKKINKNGKKVAAKLRKVSGTTNGKPLGKSSVKKKSKSGISSKLMPVMKTVSQIPLQENRDEAVSKPEEVSKSGEVAEVLPIKTSKPKKLLKASKNNKNGKEVAAKLRKVSRTTNGNPLGKSGVKIKSKSGISSKLMSVMKTMSQIPPQENRDEGVSKPEETEEVSKSGEVAEVLPIKTSKPKKLCKASKNNKNGKKVAAKLHKVSGTTNGSPLRKSGVKIKSKSGISSKVMSQIPPQENRDEAASKPEETEEVSKSGEIAEVLPIKTSKPKKLRKASKNIGNKVEFGGKTKKQLKQEQDERTIFVGNVDVKCGKRKLLAFFAKYGPIEAIRLRSVAPAQPEVSKKEAIIKLNIHPKRNTCNAYVRFKMKDMMEAALEANGMILLNNHIRVDRAIPQNTQDKQCAVFVGNLPFECEDESLYKHFEDCGKIVSVRVIRDEKFSSGKGFGYVNFKSSDAVEVALQLDGKPFMKRDLRIQRCVKKAKRVKSKGDNAPLEGQSIGFMKLKGRSKMSLKFMKNKKKNVATGSFPDKKNSKKNKQMKKNSTGDFSGKKMMERKQFKKMKKGRQRLNKEERKKMFVSRHLTGSKPMRKKK